MTSDIQNAVFSSIAKQKQMPMESISLNSTLESLNISSLDAISIVYEIEDMYDIEIPNEILDNLHNVQDIIEATNKLISK